MTELLSYKAQLAGIQVIVQEESYTSKASFLDLDELPVYDPAHPKEYEFSGKRVKRGLYQAKDGRTLHADVNGSYNTLRKVVASRLWQGDRGARSSASTSDGWFGQFCQGRRRPASQYQPINSSLEIGYYSDKHPKHPTERGLGERETQKKV